MVKPHQTDFAPYVGRVSWGFDSSLGGKTFTLIYNIMKDSFNKIQSLADELAKNADLSNGGA